MDDRWARVEANGAKIRLLLQKYPVPTVDQTVEELHISPQLAENLLKVLRAGGMFRKYETSINGD